MKISILGAQGSGKSTHSRFLAKKLNLPIVDVGQLIRNYCSSPLNMNSDECVLMRTGDLVPDTLAGRLLKNVLETIDTSKGFIIDGYPRSLDQLTLFDPHTDKVIYLNISEEESVKRLSERGRIDDTPEGVKRRLAWYHEKTTKVLEYYKNEGKLIEVNGEQDEDIVFDLICKALNI